MKIKKRNFGLILSFIAFISVLYWPAWPGLPAAGKMTLALTLVAIIWWSVDIIHPAYTTLLLLAAFVSLKLAPASVVFGLWTSPIVWLMIGSFLIARAVTESGLATRLANFVIARFVSTFRGLIALAYALGLILSLIIPHPFPRALIIMAVYQTIIDSCGFNRRQAASLGFAVFSSATVTGMFFFTGDTVMNIAAVSFAGVPVTWLEWAKIMVVPGLVASVLMLGLHFLVFRLDKTDNVNVTQLKEQLQTQGKMSKREIKTLIWVAVAVVLWATDYLHGINLAWITLFVVVGMSFPYIGGILTAEDLSKGVNWPIVLFVVGAAAIGTVGTSTGLAGWLAGVFLPSSSGGGGFQSAAMVGGMTMVLHMFLGSALATISVVAPPLVKYANSLGWSPLVPVLWAYTAVQIHFILPFHHIAILVGEGETGKYTKKEVVRYGIPLTAVALFIIVFVEVIWWKIIKLY